MAKTAQKDLVIIGAGLNGLVNAKTYLEVNPSVDVVILESAATVGGVWAAHRLYPGLKSNNMLGTFEFSDFPMDTATYGVKPGEHIPGAVMHRYLTDYSKKFGILERIIFETSVDAAELLEDGDWLLTTKSVFSDIDALCEKKISTKRLIVATGMTSQPVLPTIEGSERFGVPLFHNKDFLKFADTLDTAKTVTVFGGTKSAWDLVYEYASRGIKVDWIIRESGHGPCWMAPPYVTPLKKWLEKLAHTRFLTWLSPCIWTASAGYQGIQNFYHSTSIGRSMVDTFWSVLGNDVLTLNKYDSHPETAKLKPWSNPFFVATSLSILNYPTDFFELVRNGTVSVHITDIVSLTRNTVHTSDGSRFITDALICATGWKHIPPINFLPKDLDLGLPPPADAGARDTSNSSLFARADTEILTRFPRLIDQPVDHVKNNSLNATPGVSDPSHAAEEIPSTYLLYRFMVPPSLYKARSIAFAGAMMSISTPMLAQGQALWITAFFEHARTGTEPTDMLYETVLHNRFGKWRHPAGHGATFPDIVFDALPYLDLLMGDLGLQVHRKGGALNEIFSPYGPEDYKDLVGEWNIKRRTAKRI